MSHSQDAEARRRTPFPVSIHLPEGEHFLRGVPGLEITKCFVRRQWSAGQRLRYQNWTGGVCTERWTIRRLTLKKERFLFFSLRRSTVQSDAGGFLGQHNKGSRERTLENNKVTWSSPKPRDCGKPPKALKPLARDAGSGVKASETRQQCVFLTKTFIDPNLQQAYLVLSS